MKKSISFPIALLAPCLLLNCTESENGNFDCRETGISRNSGSNWVFLDETAPGCRLATKYPIVLTSEVFDSQMNPVNSSTHTLDSAKLMSIPEKENGFREFVISWAGIDQNGNPAKSGCYKIRYTAVAAQSSLAAQDIPNDVDAESVMECVFEFTRE